jgi:hypothetical protein
MSYLATGKNTGIKILGVLAPEYGTARSRKLYRSVPESGASGTMTVQLGLNRHETVIE